MAIAVIGGTGLIGNAVAEALSPGYEIVRISRHTSTPVDIEDPDSIRAMYSALGELDALVCAAGKGAFGKLADLTDDAFTLGLRNKLMGQINLVRFGMDHLRDGGSFTLTSGLLATRPSVGSAVLATVNAGLEGFVRAAALELPRGIRINVVSPGWVKETLENMGRDSSAGTPVAEVAHRYVAAVQGPMTGQTLTIG